MLRAPGMAGMGGAGAAHEYLMAVALLEDGARGGGGDDGDERGAWTALRPRDDALSSGSSKVSGGSGTGKAAADDDLDDNSGGSGGELGAQPTSNNRQKRNAEACRRSRRKRKAAMENLRKRNDELEEARDMYLERIAELQLELGALKHSGKNDIARENELLRAEISKHKASIAKILRATAEAPEMLPEERVRLLEGSIESSIGQIVGLAHTSVAWEPLPPFRSQEGIDGHMRQQLLPENVPVDQIKRWTCRIDFCDLPVAANRLYEALWADERDPSSRKKTTHENLADGVKRTVDGVNLFEGSPELKTALGERLAMNKYTEMSSQDGEKPHKTTLMCCSTRSSKVLVPRALVPSDDRFDESALMAATYRELAEGAERCYVISTFESTKRLHQVQLLESSELEDVPMNTNMFWGWLVIPTHQSPARCHLALIFSSALGYLTHMLDARGLIVKDGTLTDDHEQFLQYQCTVVNNLVTSLALSEDQDEATK